MYISFISGEDAAFTYKFTSTIPALRGNTLLSIEISSNIGGGFVGPGGVTEGVEVGVTVGFFVGVEVGVSVGVLVGEMRADAMIFIVKFCEIVLPSLSQHVISYVFVCISVYPVYVSTIIVAVYSWFG